ncbi:hypothetical protein [Streptomyces sp. MMS24-I29]|uniref:hypothetical protein n=1 Tax=Streptomyces sp. MMS24-I29 TaxID=3351480 RepID=UPI003C7B1AFB
MNTPTTTSLSFAPSPCDKSWGPEWVPRDNLHRPTTAERLTQSEFIWDNFKVNATLKIGGADFSDAADFVCALDFVLMLQAARVTLHENVLTVAELSDRQDEWHFTRNNDVICLRTRYATREGWRFRPAEGQCQISEFDNLVEQALSDALALIFSTQPATRRNPYLQGLASKGFEAA